MLIVCEINFFMFKLLTSVYTFLEVPFYFVYIDSYCEKLGHIRHLHVLFSGNKHKNYLIIQIYPFSHILSMPHLNRYIWSKMNIIFVILMFSLLGIDTKIVKILSFNFIMFCHFSVFSGHMDGIGQK